jgi:hypothetical protein
MSFKPGARTTEREPFAFNALRFATREEAEQWAADLFMRWTACQDTTVEESTDPVNYAIVDGQAQRVEEAAS